MDISYNCLNLPSHAETADGSSLTYTYLADGTKMLVTNSGRGLRYIGSFTYSVAGANNFALESIADVSPGLTAPVILEQNDYLPFGTKVQNSSYASITENRYRYAGKEEQNIGGINLSLLDLMAGLVKEGCLTLPRMVQLMCHNPAILYRIDRRGFIRKGYHADLALVDMDVTRTLSAEREVTLLILKLALLSSSLYICNV